VVENEIRNLESVKTQFALNVRFSITRDGVKQQMERYFKQREPAIFNRNNVETVNSVLRQSIDEFKGEIEAWSQRGSGWVAEAVLDAFVNVARYQPFRGGSYIILPQKLKIKKAIINVKNRDNKCLRWALRAALFPATVDKNPARPSIYPTENGLNVTGIAFPTPVKQIDKLEKQNPNLAINVFGWEEERVIVHRLSEKDGSLPRINLRLIQDKEKSHYTYVKGLNRLLYDQNRYNESKHFCERGLRGYQRKELLERHKPECMGQLKRPTRTELPKKGENKVRFKNHHKQMKALFMVYADFESLIRKIRGCAQKGQAVIQTEVHEPCGFSYIIVKSDGQTHGPYVYRGGDAVYQFLVSLQYHEKFMRSELADKKPIVMTKEDWIKFNTATKCHICNESLVKAGFRDAFDAYDPNTGEYRGQSHKRCYYNAMRGFVGPRRERKPKGPENKACIFCGKPLMVNNYRDAVKDHCHITGKYRGAAHNDCNLKLRIKPKTAPIPVIFHNLKGYHGHLLMQVMSRVTGHINCIPNNMEK